MKRMQGIEGTSGRLGVCPHCGKTAELVMCPACGLEMIDCEDERGSKAYNDYQKAKQKAIESGDDNDIAILELARMAWQEHVFDHYVCNKGSEEYYTDSFKRWSFIKTVCPFCDSIKTQEITFAEKFSDFISKGFKGKKRKMECHCNDCGRDY